MPELQWDPFDFMYCLEVEPEIEEFWTSYSYQVRKDGIVLALTVYPLESLVYLSLRQEKSEFPLVEFAVFVRGKIRHINDKRGEYLEFVNCVIAPDRFSHREAEGLFESATPDWTLRLSIKPSVRIGYTD